MSYRNHKSSSPGNSGFTLLEVLLSMGLLIVLISILWSLIRLYSNYYMEGTGRANRSQIVRSLSQLLSEDLGAAIQDPIHPLPPSLLAGDSVRRFGLWGTSRSLRIDVVQINPLDPGAKKEIQRRAGIGPVQGIVPQVPELKTVFYDFVPLSEFRGSSQKIKCGLTRGELNFETPVDSPAPLPTDSLEQAWERGAPDQIRAVGTGGNPEDVFAVFTEESPSFPPNPDWEGNENGTAFSGDAIDSRRSSPPSPKSIAEELFRSVEGNAMWAPEVVDCRFRYSDGSQWFDSWDSIERNGLPLAVEAVLQLMPLEDVEKIRRSPLLAGLRTSSDQSKESEYELPGAREVGTGVLPNSESDSGLERVSAPRFATLESLAIELGLNPPLEQRIVSYLPTSPMRKSDPIRRPAPPVKKEAIAAPQVQPPTDWIAPPPAETTMEEKPKPPAPVRPMQQWIRGSESSGRN